MKNNAKELIEEIVAEVLSGREGERVNIEDILNEYMPLLSARANKSFFVKFWFRSRITSAFNSHEIYSCNTETIKADDGKEYKEQGYFIALKNANLSQLGYFEEKAHSDLNGIQKRVKRINEKLGQISMYANEKNDLELDIPEAINL